jgi:hypothetical protein
MGARAAAAPERYVPPTIMHPRLFPPGRVPEAGSIPGKGTGETERNSD